MPNFAALKKTLLFKKTVLFYVRSMSCALLGLTAGSAYAVVPVAAELTPLAVPQHCHDASDINQTCRSLSALAQFVGFQNIPDYLHFVTHQLNHDYQLAPLQTATSLAQEARFIANHNDYVNGRISRAEQTDTMVSLANEVMKQNLAQLGVTDLVSAQYHTTRLRILSNLALANRPRQRGVHDENEAAYLSHTLLQADPNLMQTLSHFSSTLLNQRQRCLRVKPRMSDVDLRCASVHIVGDSLALQPPHQLEKVLAKLARYLVDDQPPTAAQRIAVSTELEDFDGYALSQRRERATATDSTDGPKPGDADLRLPADYRAKDLALQALHDTNLEQLQREGLALHIVGQAAGARMTDYAMVASATGTFDTLVDLYRLSQQLFQIWQLDATGATPAELPFAQTRSRIEYWVGVEDDVFDLLMQLHGQRGVASEYQVILTQAGVQAWDLRPVVSQIYRNSDPNDYVNVVQTGYTLPVHFDGNTTLFRYRMRRNEAANQ